MERLYSINSVNGRGYNMSLINKKDNNKKNLDDFNEFQIENLDSLWTEKIIETKPGICFNCKKDLSKCSVSDNNNKYKLLHPCESLFIYSTKGRDTYCYHYIHFCSECMNNNLYLWSIKNTQNKYPYLRVHAQSFLWTMKSNDFEKINIPKNISFPRIYRCEYYLGSNYDYLDDCNTIYNEEQIEYKNKLKYMDKCDLNFDTF